MLSRRSFHHIAFSIFPVLYIFERNFSYFSADVLPVPLISAAAFSIALYLAFNLIGGYRFFELAFSVKTGSVLIVLWIVLSAAGVFFIGRIRREISSLTWWLNATSLILCLISSAGIAVKKAGHYLKNDSGEITEDGGSGGSRVSAGMELPDIYYIILDGYARADILDDIYGFDNGEFTGFLEERGFHIAGASAANYCQTILSVASALNFEYINDGSGAMSGLKYRDELIMKIKHNKVASFLKSRGYTTIAIASGYFGTEDMNADVLLNAGNFSNEFLNILLSSTFAEPVIRLGGGTGFLETHRMRILSVLDQLRGLSGFREPIFVFAHIVSPHPPFVFGENGERTDFPETYNFHDGSYLIRDGGLSRDEYVEGYRSQLVFVNSRIKDVLNAILSNAARKKIVILQSDHGPGSMLEWENPDNQDFRERMFILNAFYFPDGDYSRLYKDISPVNTFRAVFNQFFGTELPLLEDRSYFSTWGAPYRFYDVSEKIGTR